MKDTTQMNSTTTVENPLPLIVQLLDKAHEFDAQKMAAIRAVQVKENSALEELLIRKGYASEQEIAAAYAEYYMLPLYDAEKNAPQIDKRLRRVLSEKLCRDHFIAPVAVRDESLDVAFFTPNELLLVDELQLVTGREIQPLFAPLSVVERLLNALFNNSQWPASDADAAPSGSAQFEQVEDQDEISGGEDSSEEVLHLDQPPPPGRDGRVIRFVNQIFEQAFRGGASDVHIEPFEDRCRVRLRIDGSLTEISPPPVSMYTPIVSRIKVLAKMDIAEKRLPQDGAIALRSGDKRVDVRVNTCPTVHGEKVVMRILDKGAIPLQLTALGLDERQDKDLAESIQSPHGMMLVTGPTGSGKSTTLYACLNLLNKADTNICTVEDPVEYKFQGINQIQTKAHIGLTFADALRSFLRQDPDIIMVGEVRDAETAQICLRAALTGHFVLSTLHTNDALAAVNRLADMGVEPFLLASTLRVIVAQRLIRRLCQKCREEDVLDAQTTDRLGLSGDDVIYRPRGCRDCRQTGYKGRVGVFEVIRITRGLAGLIQNRAPLSELRQAAMEQGMKLLTQSAMEKARAGLTSLEEVLSITLSEEA